MGAAAGGSMRGALGVGRAVAGSDGGRSGARGADATATRAVAAATASAAAVQTRTRETPDLVAERILTSSTASTPVAVPRLGSAATRRENR
jgi:hypothetical protein